MSVNLIRDYYEYHFTINRKIWDQCITRLSNEQLLQEVDYGVGSIRNQVVHMMSVDDAWFHDLLGIEFVAHMNPVDYPTLEMIRKRWDEVEQKMGDALATLDDDLLMQPFPGSNGTFSYGQALLHVVNHGTDHRAQLLKMLHAHGIETFPQDYIFYIMRHM